MREQVIDFNSKLRGMWVEKALELSELKGRQATNEWEKVLTSLVYGLSASIAAASGGDRALVRDLVNAATDDITDLCLELVAEVEAQSGER